MLSCFHYCGYVASFSVIIFIAMNSRRLLVYVPQYLFKLAILLVVVLFLNSFSGDILFATLLIVLHLLKTNVCLLIWCGTFTP